MRAAIYCRISADPRQHEAGVQRQEQDCRELAQRRGWTVADVFVDNNRSAWKRDRRRPGWDLLMAGLEQKAYDAIVVWHGDRLMRQPRDLEDLLDIADRGVQLASPSSQRDLSDPDDRYILRIEVAHACRSSDDTSRRVRRAHERMAEVGRSAGGGTRPFGFRDDRRTHDPAEADMIREAVKRLLSGDTIRGVCADWNERGVPTVTGVAWSPFTLRRIVISPRTAGWREFRGAWLAPAEWDAIAPEDQIRTLSVILSDPARRQSQRVRRYLLTGFADCGVCGAKLVARPKADGRRCYVCAKGPGYKGCGKIRVLAQSIEDDIGGRVVDFVNSPDIERALEERGDNETAPLLAELDAINTARIQLADEFEGDVIFTKRRLAKLAEQEESIGSRLSRAQTRRPILDLGELLPEVWDDEMTFDQKRTMLAAIGARVTVGPAVRGRNVYDPKRVVFETTSSSL